MKKRVILGVTVAFLMLAGADKFLGSNAGAVLTRSDLVRTAPVEMTAEEATPSRPVVTRVVDGDTIVVLIDGISEKVRLIGVNTPETVDPRKSVQCFGKESSQLTKSLVLNKEVVLDADPSQDNRDKYGRLLRYVFLKDGTFLNNELIARGYGYEYTYRTPYLYQTKFKDAERTARESKRGLWADGACGLTSL